jgi:hypothetical protein
MSAIAGATNPTISSGIINPRNSENTPLKVTKIEASQSGKMNPAPIPAMMAMIIRRSSGMRKKVKSN